MPKYTVANLDVDAKRSVLLALEAVDRTRSADGVVLPEAGARAGPATPALVDLA